MAKSYSHLTLEERTLIQTQLQLGSKPAAIAAGLLRPRACITRELTRNGWLAADAPVLPRPVGRPPVPGIYCAQHAHKRARRLLRQSRVPRKLLVGHALWSKVTDGLGSGLSPEQIAGTLQRMDAPDRLGHETIYKAIYAIPRGALRTEIMALLRFGRNQRRPRARGAERRGKIPNRISMEQRPAEIAERQLPGHWEGDLIKGQGHRSQVGTLVERQTLFVALVKLDKGPAEAAAAGCSSMLQRFADALRPSLTYEQGREMTPHATLTANTGVTVYFAHAHSPWERGRHENTNGLLRQ